MPPKLPKYSSATDYLRALCNAGCDRKFLTVKYTMLTRPPEIQSGKPVPRRNETTGEVESTLEPRRARLRPQFEPLQYGPGENERFTLKELRKLAARAKTILKAAEKLKRTPLVKDLQARGRLSRNDVLATALLVQPSALHGVIALPTLAKASGTTLDSETERLLAEICQHVRRTTNGWHDALVSGWLQHTNRPHVGSAETLKAWRTRQRLKG